MSDTSVLEHASTETITSPFAGDGDHDLFSHYVPKRELESAIFLGTPTRALCGKLWLPTKDPSRYAVCPECKEVFGLMQPGDTDSPDYRPHP